MKSILLILLLASASISASVPAAQSLTLPRVDEVSGVTILPTSMIDWYTPVSLLKILPRLVPSAGTYLAKVPLQRGTLTLKNGTVLKWMAADRTSLLIYSDQGERLFILPQETKPSATTTQKDPPPGNIKLLPGYQHKTFVGIDTSVGKIWKEGGVEILYDIGTFAGIRIDPTNLAQYLWYKEQTVGGHPVRLALDKNSTLLVYFPDSYANFAAGVKSQEDIADVLLMVLTYRQ